ncbi:hypothetical protein DL98DRAFT_526290 [Cadophora sp. DSE1049]|nr:hypothetical protein DL98DRAFT_526290 [Cadophora sp. DSE1049]
MGNPDFIAKDILSLPKLGKVPPVGGDWGVYGDIVENITDSLYEVYIGSSLSKNGIMERIWKHQKAAEDGLEVLKERYEAAKERYACREGFRMNRRVLCEFAKTTANKGYVILAESIVVILCRSFGLSNSVNQETRARCELCVAARPSDMEAVTYKGLNKEFPAAQGWRGKSRKGPCVECGCTEASKWYPSLHEIDGVRQVHDDICIRCWNHAGWLRRRLALGANLEYQFGFERKHFRTGPCVECRCTDANKWYPTLIEIDGVRQMNDDMCKACYDGYNRRKPDTKKQSPSSELGEPRASEPRRIEPATNSELGETRALELTEDKRATNFELGAKRALELTEGDPAINGWRIVKWNRTGPCVACKAKESPKWYPSFCEIDGKRQGQDDICNRCYNRMKQQRKAGQPLH